ncbi:MAG: hypothetical protein GXP53_00600 [Deltaproteobacteria bacterium]|nr:hypothetical protein [Deltaproteobacteria bacterium]
MKRSMVKSIFLMVLAVFVFTAPICMAAEETEPTASADISVLNKYIWRGYELSDSSIVIQPSVTVSYRNFSFNFWGNLDTDTDSGAATTNRFNETDMTLSYDTSLSGVNIGFGYIYYALNSPGSFDSQEVYLSAGLDTLLSPTLTVYREIADSPATYINFGVSHAFKLPHEISLELAGSAGYYISNTNNLTEVNDPTEKYKAFHDGLVSATLTVPVDKYITISPMIAWSFLLSEKADHLLKSTSFNNKSSFIFGGVTCSIAF